MKIRRHFRTRHRPLSVEPLESRQLLALLTAEAFAEARARFHTTVDGPHQVTHATQAIATATPAAIGFSTTDALAEANADGGAVKGRARGGGAAFAPQPPQDGQGDFTSRATTNWIIRGVPSGTQVPIDMAFQIAGFLDQTSNSLTPPTDYQAEVTAQLRVTSDVTPDEIPFQGHAILVNQLNLFEATGAWQFSRLPNFQNRHETNHTGSFQFNISAGEPFSVEGEIVASARANTFEIFVDTDFDTSGGLTYSMTTNIPGAVIEIVGQPPSATDTDGDGVDDVIEDQGPNGGDVGRCVPNPLVVGDGTPDSQQATVATYFDSTAADYVTLVLCEAAGHPLPADASLANVREATNQPPVGLTGNVMAAFEAEVHGVDPGTPVIVRVLPQFAAEPDSYYHYGTEPADLTAHWFEFPYDGTSGGQLNPRSADVHVTDGGAGDADDAADGNLFISGALSANRPGNDHIVGIKFIDSNGNGVQDPGEPHLAGWPVFLDDNQNGVWDENSERLTSTNDVGEFAFLDVERRTHTVAEANQFGFRQTAPAPFHDPLDITGLGTVRTTASGDFNGDGRVDLVIPNDNETIVLLNRGGGRFEESERLGVLGSDEAVAVADFDGDGILDLAITHTLSDGIAVRLGNGDGTFNLKPSGEPSTVLFPVGQQPYGILAAHLVGDSNQVDNIVDLVTVNLLSADITILKGRGDGGFDQHSSWSVGSVGVTDSVVTGDFDADGNVDLAIANGQTEELTLLWSNGTGGFTVDTRIVPGIESEIVAGQFNTGFGGDEHLDVAVTANGALLVRYGDGQREFPDTRVIPTTGGTPTSLTALDFDQDGNTDLVAAVQANETVAFFRQEATIDSFGVLRDDFVPVGTQTVAGNPLHLGTARLDSDSFEELIVSSSLDERVQVLSGNPYRYARVRLGEAHPVPAPLVAFGNQVRDGGEIRGTVWKDLDADGIRDLSTADSPADPPLPGELIYIDLNDDGALDSRLEPFRLSDVQGSYTFRGLPEGVYTLRTDVLPNWAQTSPATSWLVTVPARQTVSNIDFGIAPPGEIRGTVYLDSDRNGQHDLGEQPLVDWEVFLDSNDGTIHHHTTTDVDGAYVFPDLPPGSYIVTQTLPPGWEASAAPPVLLGQAGIHTLDFANRGALRLSGTVWEDENANGHFDAGESPRAGLTIFADRNQNTWFDPGEIATQSDASGNYELLVPPGTYSLTQSLDDDPRYMQTFPATPAYVVSIDPNSPGQPYDFGSRIRPGPSEVEGYVRIDENGNGFHDSGEPGRAGATVYLDFNQNERFDAGEPTTLTDADGRYVFPNVQTGRVGLAPEEPWLQLSPLAVPDRSIYPGFSVFGVRDQKATFANLNPQTDAYLDYAYRTFDSATPTTPSIHYIDYSLNTGPARSFGSLRSVALPVRPERMFVTDANSDDQPDFLTTYHFNNILRFVPVLGDGLGGFQISSKSPTVQLDAPAGAYTSFIQATFIGHLNPVTFDPVTGNPAPGTDDIPDVVVAQLAKYHVARGVDRSTTRLYTVAGGLDTDGDIVFGEPTFQATVSSVEGSSGNYVFIKGLADVDGDGQPEIVLSNERRLEFWTQQGEPSGAVETSYFYNDGLDLLQHSSNHVILSDLDQDGDLDAVAIGTHRCYRNYLLECGRIPATFLTGDGTGRFAPETQLIHKPTSGRGGLSDLNGGAVAGDFDGDGHTDLIAGGQLLLATDDQTRYRIGDQSFQLVDRTLHGTYFAHTQLAIDIDADGALDTYEEQSYFLENDGSTTDISDGFRYGPLMRPGTAPTNRSYDFLVARQSDSDADGVSTRTEDRGPGGGDGNGDGVRDSQQPHVTSIPNTVDGSYLTIVAPVGTQLVDVRVEANPDPANSPPGVQFPFGFVSFTLEGLTTSQHVAVEIITHGSAMTNAFHKYGPTPADPTDHFYSFSLGAILPPNCETNPSCVGAFASVDSITLYLTDGLTGDSDLTANGRIVDPGAPAILVTQTPPTVTAVIRNDEADSPGELTSLTFQFDEDVSADLSLNDLVLQSETNGTPVDLTGAFLDTATGRWDLAALALPPGRYSAMLLAAGVQDAAGNLLDGDGDGIGGDDYIITLLVALPGDANLDGIVDAADLNILALNWRTPGTGWGSADFTKDEMVDAADLNALALHWRQDVSASPVAAAGPVGFIPRVPRAPLPRRSYVMDRDTLPRDMQFTHTAVFSEHDYPSWIWFSGSVALPIQDHLPSHRETSLQRTRSSFAKLNAVKVPDDEDIDAWHDWVDIAISDWTEQQPLSR